jgi:c-di-GMP-binding flagellar brake protein YcgR
MERRAYYRVTSEEITGVQARVRTSKGAIIAGEPTNVSVDGAALRFPVPVPDRTGGPVFEVGEEVELQFSLPTRDAPVLLKATVIHRTEEEGARQYGFQFAGRTDLESQLAPALYWLFNRRTGHRVKPALDSPIGVTLHVAASGSTMDAQLLDISTGGMGLGVPLAAESALAVADRVRVFLSLPAHEPRLDLVVKIRNRCLMGPEVRYGVEYDLEQTRDAQRQLGVITAFVMEGRRAILHQRETTP